MQTIAKENNLAETAFVIKNQNDYQIRWFTPTVAELSKLPSRGVIVTSQGSEVDFVSRFFAPQSGIPEDYVTGSAHTSLVPFWSEKFGKQQFVAKQLSERGGKLICNYLGDRVEIGGHAVTYLIGEISI